jgi:ferritin-like metal-binding protein YciE
MMKTKTLKDLFLDELADMYDAEKRIVKALPKLAKAATCTELKAALEKHLQETQGHVTKLEQVFQCFDLPAKGKTCEATKGLLEEGDEIAADFKGTPAINAAIVSAAQKVEHYEMASYGCLHEWAELLGNQQAAALLETILNEEKAANEGLTELAIETCNPEAMGEPGDLAGGMKLPKPSGKSRQAVSLDLLGKQPLLKTLKKK